MKIYCKSMLIQTLMSYLPRLHVIHLVFSQITVFLDIFSELIIFQKIWKKTCLTFNPTSNLLWILPSLEITFQQKKKYIYFQWVSFEVMYKEYSKTSIFHLETSLLFWKFKIISRYDWNERSNLYFKGIHL
jgi:hypothetical protein